MALRTREALVLGLAEGPAFGSALVRRVATLSNRAVRLNLGGASTTLRTLERAGLARSWTAAVGVGRPRRYYELTADGILVADSLRRDLAGLVSPRRDPVSPARLKTMAAHLERASVLSASAMALRDAGRKAGLA